MEIGLESGLPTYSGGLGILAGDYAFALADLGVKAVFVTLLYRKGFVSQRTDATAGQIDLDEEFNPARFLVPLDKRVEIEVAGKAVKVGASEYRVKGKSEVPVVFLDTDVEGNDGEARRITDSLYGGDPWHRLNQEIILGVGGYRMLQALGYRIDKYHLNEGHAALLMTELLRDYREREEIRKRCVFTSHTSVAAGYEVFPVSMVRQALNRSDWVDWNAEATGDRIELSRMALKYSCVTNAVSLKHRHVSEHVLGERGIEYVTNGVYHRRWVHGELKKLYDRYFPGWQGAPSLLTAASRLPTTELSAAHHVAKSELLEKVNRLTGSGLEDSSLTIGMAKRATGYKRNGLIFADIDRLIDAANRGGIQVVVAGKSHPSDGIGKAIIRYILNRIQEIQRKTDSVKAAFVEDYDIEMAGALVAGCDLWLNNPRRPLEACGTSGMKAAMNGVLNFSEWDGWWMEGGIEGVNGWGIGRKSAWNDMDESSDSEDLDDIYQKLSNLILPTYYTDQPKWWEMAKASIATAIPSFNAYRMVDDYLSKVYKSGDQS